MKNVILAVAIVVLAVNVVMSAMLANALELVRPSNAWTVVAVVSMPAAVSRSLPATKRF